MKYQLQILFPYQSGITLYNYYNIVSVNCAWHPLGDSKVMRLILGQNHIIPEDVKKLYLQLLYQMCNINTKSRVEMPWPITGDYEQLGLFWTKFIKGLVVYNSWDLYPLDLPVPSRVVPLEHK